MKKYLWVLCLCLAIFPALIFAGCGKKESAKDVKGHQYVISTAKRGDEVMQDLLDNKLRISFADNYFTVEYGIEGTAQYGAYLGSYATEKNTITLTTTAKNGAFSTKIPEYMQFTTLTFSKGKLLFEDIVRVENTSKIYKFEFSKIK